MVLKSRVKEEFEIEPVTSAEMDALINECVRTYKGNPKWLDEENGTKTVNFAKSVCSETARLAMLGAGITISGSQRAEWLQGRIDKIYFQLRHWIEYGCAYGTVIFKPEADGVWLVLPERFAVTEQKDGKITGAAFWYQEEDKRTKKYFSRLEWHRFENDTYIITNKCYIGESKNDKGKPVDIKKTPWSNLSEELKVKNIDRPLFGVFRTPQANNVDVDSVLGLPVFYEAMTELEDLDVAYSRNAKEIYDSKRILLLDSDRMIQSGQKIEDITRNFERTRRAMGLPDMVKNVYGDGKESFYQEINPTLNTDVRLAGINALLSQIGYKIGFSNGYFVFNESTGIQTATGVEAEQQRTIQFIKDIRDQLEICLEDLIYSLNAVASIYDLSPEGTYETVFDFGDITYNREEDRARWYGYASSNRIPFYYYLMKFEGMSEEEARALVKEAKPDIPSLFGQEE